MFWEFCIFVIAKVLRICLLRSAVEINGKSGKGNVLSKQRKKPKKHSGQLKQKGNE